MKHVFLRTALRAFRILAAGCLVLSAPLNRPAAAQVGVGTQMGNKVTLSLSDTDIVAGEPVYLMTNILNETAPLRVGNFSSRLYLAEGNDIEVFVQRPGELPERYTAAEQPGLYSSVEVNLNNGEAMDHRTLLLYDASKTNGYLFGAPGVYTVRAAVKGTVMRDPKGLKVELPPTQVTVRDPEGRNAEAFGRVNDPAMAEALQLMLTDDPAVVARAREVAMQYSDTPYAPLCRFLSGNAYYRAAPPQIDKAVADFEKFMQNYPEHPHVSEVAFQIVAAEMKGARTDLARDWYYFVRDAYPNYRLLRQNNIYSDLFYDEPKEATGARPWWLYEKPWVVKSTAATAAHITDAARPAGKKP